MSPLKLFLVVAGVWIAGCNPTTESAKDSPKGPGPGGTMMGPPPGITGTAGTTPATEPGPAKASDAGTVALTPENTRIEFVGTHAPPKAPDPRTGTFAKFAGEAKLDKDGKELESVSVEIETDSISTFNPGLTTHLKSPDFFDTREYPKAKFASTSIKQGDAGEYTIAGNLTLMKETKEISFPAKITVADGHLSLSAKFTIDRTTFGMDKMTNGVLKDVELTVSIGSKPE